MRKLTRLLAATALASALTTGLATGLAGAAWASQPSASTPQVTVTVGGDLLKEVDKLGERDVQSQLDALVRVVERALARDAATEGRWAGARLNLVVTDLKPNRPTIQQTIDRPRPVDVRFPIDRRSDDRGRTGDRRRSDPARPLRQIFDQHRRGLWLQHLDRRRPRLQRPGNQSASRPPERPLIRLEPRDPVRH